MLRIFSGTQSPVYRLLMIMVFTLLHAPVFAHHSAAMFDLETELLLEGTVTKYQFTNPHVWVHVEVSGKDGTAQIWKVEALNPNALKRKGWKPGSFKPGDKVSITVYPAKSGDTKGGFVRAITADGTKLGKPLPGKDDKETWHDAL